MHLVIVIPVQLDTEEYRDELYDQCKSILHRHCIEKNQMAVLKDLVISTEASVKVTCIKLRAEGEVPHRLADLIASPLEFIRLAFRTHELRFTGIYTSGGLFEHVVSAHGEF